MNILVVDNDSNIRKICKSLLVKEGHKVFQANTVDKGLAILKKEKIDCVLMEIMLGDIVKNGYYILEKINTFPKDARPRGLVMTSRKGILPEYTAFARGAYDLIPVSYTHLTLPTKA